MASSSTSLTLPLQLLRCGASSSRVGLRALHRPSPSSTRLQLRPTRGLRPVAAVSYHDEAAGHGDDGVAATSVLLRQLDDVAVSELWAARTVGRAPRKPKEGGGGSGGKIHATPTSAENRALRLPKEGSGGQGGSHH